MLKRYHEELWKIEDVLSKHGFFDKIFACRTLLVVNAVNNFMPSLILLLVDSLNIAPESANIRRERTEK